MTDTALSEEERIVEASLAIPISAAVNAAREVQLLLYNQALRWAGPMPHSGTVDYRAWVHKMKAFERMVLGIVMVGGGA